MRVQRGNFAHKSVAGALLRGLGGDRVVGASAAGDGRRAAGSTGSPGEVTGGAGGTAHLGFIPGSSVSLLVLHGFFFSPGPVRRAYMSGYFICEAE